MGQFSSRRAGASIVASLLLAVPLAACAPGGSASSAPRAHSTRAEPAATGPSSGATAAFDARARQVEARWNTSPLAVAWRSGLVVMDPAELTAIPANSGFTTQQQKDALAAGRFTLRGTLPSSRLPSTVTRPGEPSHLPLPPLGAQATFQRLAVNQPCPNGPCGSFTVTGASPGHLTVQSNRGKATIPAWTFTVTGPPYRVTEAALAPGSYSALPPVAPDGLAGNFGGASLAAISAGGRVLTVTFAVGDCGTPHYGGLVYQTATAVVIGSWSVPGKTSGACAMDLLVAHATVRLRAPLGARPVLDVGSGEPLAPGSPDFP
jgi:hypothetical protein